MSHRPTNNPFLIKSAMKVKKRTLRLDNIMPGGTLNQVITAAAKIENAARKLGWKAARLRDEQGDK